MKGLLFLPLLLVATLVGCLSTPPELSEEEHSPRLGIVQNSDGRTTMVWESDSDYLYTVYYRDGSRPWKELRSMIKVRGTGGSMMAEDRVNPRRSSMRRYRLHFDKVQGSRTF